MASACANLSSGVGWSTGNAGLEGTSTGGLMSAPLTQRNASS